MVAIEIVAHVIVAVRSPDDARASKDERDRTIELKAIRPAFYVLMIGALLSIGTIQVGASLWTMVHAVLLSVFLAELTRIGSQLYFYRCGT